MYFIVMKKKKIILEEIKIAKKRNAYMWNPYHKTFWGTTKKCENKSLS